MKLRSAVGALALVAIAVLAGCSTNGSQSAVPFGFEPNAHKNASMQLVGYWDGWSKNNLVDTPSGVTEIPLAFGFLHGHTITTAGGIDAGYVTASDIDALHSRGIKVTLSLGGWSPKNSFVFDGNVAGFDASLGKLLATLPLDGVDFDMEHGSTADRVKTLTTLIPAARAYFNSIGMTGAIVTYTGWNTP
ncbi:MAG: hypothetical protein JO092_00830, partial [Candidatus Eremiobacteraeota bacterium]|nr:hypothetical protein [Candidatus Eremiobacteraeota bacterium]